jgi:hypothetical protein
VRVFVFAKQYSIVLALVQALSFHPDQAKSQTPSGYGAQKLPERTAASRSVGMMNFFSFYLSFGCVIRYLAGCDLARN